jgi:uncharacterized protein (DUF1330 family)
MSAIRPNKQQFIELMGAPDEGPVVMLNLLKFKEKAEGASSESGASGADEYGKYTDQVVQMVEARGGKVIWMGRADQMLIGNPEEDWDSVALVQYPSRKDFVEMVSSPEYESAHEHREGGLERTILIACTERLSRLGEN